MLDADSSKQEIERLRAENEILRREGALFRSVFTEGNLGIAMIGIDLRLEHVNPALATMLGRTAAELVGMPISDITHPDDVDNSRELAQSLFRSQISAYRVEKRYFRKDGSTIW